MEEVMKKLLASGLFISALALLLLATAHAAAAQQAGHVEGIVVPDTVYDRQPFSFAVPQLVEGEVVSVQTVEGVVVQRSTADKFGRVFLAAGLPAGGYLISSRESRGKINIVQAYTDPWGWTGTDGWVPIPIDPICLPPGPVKINDAFTLIGKGFSADFAKAEVTLSNGGKTRTVPVLAATAMQLKLAPVEGLQPGAAELKVTNKISGRSSAPQQVMVYDLKGHLEQSKLAHGQQTIFVLNSFPEDVPMNVRATIDGPVTFGNGSKMVEGTTEKGRAVFSVKADSGSGKFSIDFEGRPVQSAKAACSCGCGGTAQPACAHRGCACSKTESVSELKSDTVLKMPAGTSTGKSGCSCGCGGTAQPRCAHKGCGCSK
jgi:hypothetical protein